MRSICSFESRRASEMTSLIERQGWIANVAPSMREIPVEDQLPVWNFIEELRAGRIELVIFLTGVGATTLLEAVETRWSRDEFFAALNRCQIALRGPKPAVVLRSWNVRIDYRAPEPNTWRELLNTLQEANAISGKRIAIQEYGEPATELANALDEQGGTVLSVPVYRWAFPDDLAPLEAAICRTVSRDFDALVFTSAQQIRNVLDVADRLGLRAQWIEAACETVIGSIGPTASATLRESGLPVTLEASPPKMGTLIKQLAVHFSAK